MFTLSLAKSNERAQLELWNNRPWRKRSTVHSAASQRARYWSWSSRDVRRLLQPSECVEICRKILVKSVTAPIVDTPRSYYRVGALEPERNQLICSFCGTSQQEAHRLIGATPKLPHAFICDQCVQRCEATIGSGSTTPVRDWLARRTGRHDTTIHHIG